MERTDIQTEYGLVILLDVLGIKGIWRDQDPTKILKEWSFITNSWESFVIEYGKKFGLITSFHVFSDTVIMTVTGELEKSFSDFSDMIHAILHISIFEDFPVRGAISLGTFYQSEKMVIGPAIDECSQFYELADSIGIIVAPSYHGFLERMSRDPNRRHDVDFDYIKSDIPIRDRKVLRNSFMVRIKGWTPVAEAITDKNPKIKTLEDLIHYKLEHLTSIEASSKLKNTLELIEKSKPLQKKISGISKKSQNH